MLAFINKITPRGDYLKHYYWGAKMYPFILMLSAMLVECEYALTKFCMLEIVLAIMLGAGVELTQWVKNKYFKGNHELSIKDIYFTALPTIELSIGLIALEYFLQKK